MSSSSNTNGGSNVQQGSTFSPFVLKDKSQLPNVDGLKICCIGAGYVGGPTMAMIAKSK